MLTWMIVLLAIIAIFVVSRLIHFNHFKHKLFAILLILLVAFLFVSIIGVVKSYNINLKSPEGILNAGKVYYSWLAQAFGNVKSLTGQAIGMDWTPENVSISKIIQPTG